MASQCLAFPSLIVSGVSAGYAGRGRRVGLGACAPDPCAPVPLWFENLCVSVSLGKKTSRVVRRRKCLGPRAFRL